MRAEIITSGTELLLGEITDTNTPFLSRELAKIGINIYHHTTVGDNPKRLLDAIKQAETRAEIIIISGGLGPTEDDITKNVLADHLGVELKLDEESLEKVQKRYGTAQLSKGNHKQALILEKSEPLKNDVGMAAGVFFKRKENTYVLLPGPPNEFEYMVKNHLIPKLLSGTSQKESLKSRTLNFYGLGEAVVANKLHELIIAQTNPTIAIYAREGIIEVRLAANCSSDKQCVSLLDEVEADILNRIGKYFIGYGQTTILATIIDELVAKNKTISLLEVQTDGKVISEWSSSMNDNAAFKGGLYFSKLNDTISYYEMEKRTNVYEQQETKEMKEILKQLAQQTREKFGSDYSVSVMGVANQNSYKFLIGFGGENETVITKEIDLSERTYNPPWLISIRVNDFIRRQLLSLPLLSEK